MDNMKIQKFGKIYEDENGQMVIDGFSFESERKWRTIPTGLLSNEPLDYRYEEVLPTCSDVCKAISDYIMDNISHPPVGIHEPSRSDSQL